MGSQRSGSRVVPNEEARRCLSLSTPGKCRVSRRPRRRYRSATDTTTRAGTRERLARDLNGTREEAFVVSVSACGSIRCVLSVRAWHSSFYADPATREAITWSRATATIRGKHGGARSVIWAASRTAPTRSPRRWRTGNRSERFGQALKIGKDQGSEVSVHVLGTPLKEQVGIPGPLFIPDQGAWPFLFLSISLTVTLSSPGGYDVAPFSETVTIGPNVTSHIVTIPISNDGQSGERDATIPLSLSSPGSGASIGATTTASLVIHDDNPFPAPVIVESVRWETIKVKVGNCKRARTKSETALEIQFSGLVAGTGDLAAYQLSSVTTRRVKRRAFTSYKPIRLTSAVPASNPMTSRGTDIDRPAFTEYSMAWPRLPGSRVERPCKPCFPKPNLEESASMNQHLLLNGHVTYTAINPRGDPTVNSAARHARVGCRIKPGHPIRAPIHPGGAPRPICASSPQRPASGGRPPRGSAGTGWTRPRRRTHRPEDAR